MNYNQILKENEKVRNYEGAVAYKMPKEVELYTAVCTMMVQAKFYESPQEQIDRIAKLIREVSTTYVAKLAIYAREEMYLRSIPLFLIVELSKVHSGDDLISRTIEWTVNRADEIMELLMCYQWRNPSNGNKKLGKLSHQIQIGLQRCFKKFDEYQFAKYNRSGKEVKMRDALFVVHPKANSEAQQAVYDKIANNTLPTPYTWETELSTLGKQSFDTPEAKKKAFAQKWIELIESGKLGYMALLRNLRNIIMAEVDDDTIMKVAQRISSEKEVLHSKQLPFRYLSAYKELKHVDTLNTPFILTALEKAAAVSAANIHGFSEDTNVLIACDTSGSMDCPLSYRSHIKYYEVALMLAMLLHSRCRKVIPGIFADEWEVVNLPNSNILSNVDTMREMVGKVGYGTDGGKVIEWMIERQVVVDKVMFFTDCQLWSRYDIDFTLLWNKYKRISPKAHMYIFNLAGYAQMSINVVREDVTVLSGWNERVFDMLHSMENATDIVKRINDIKI